MRNYSEEYGKNLDDMSEEELKDVQYDCINARESFPEDSMNDEALALDDEYADLDLRIQALKTIRSYIEHDMSKKEVEEDEDEPLVDYTFNKCRNYIDKNVKDVVDFIAHI